ncbi:MAG TPA: phosphoribosyltransferase family protein [Thermoanaerobaculia bacterium]|nr:phosphoribosyltransferase family protein [Thermoanaerobaculia bacterium]
MLLEAAREAVRTLLPSWCIVCDRELPWTERTASCCADCWRTLPRITGAKCISCALPLVLGPQSSVLGPNAAASEDRGPRTEDSSLRCIECQLDPGDLLFCDAWGRYSGSLEKVLHAFKFERHDFLDDPLAALLEELLKSSVLGPQSSEVRGPRTEDRGLVDAIVPVPMSRAKERKRGYNQAERLARALGRRANVACELLLTKRGERATQSLLPRAERAKNVRGAFQASPRADGKAILLVDDICTTGETLRSCASELLRAGATSVAAVTVAKTV